MEFVNRNAKMKILLLTLLIYFNRIEKCTGVSHWIVTQTGKVQPYLETPFDLRWPYDLLALLDQETRWNEINELYDDLMKRKEIIEKKWSNIEKNSNGLKASSQDSNCLEAVKLFSVIDLYGNLASNGTERDGIELKIPNKINVANVNEPLCNDFAKLNKKSSSLPTNKTNITLLKDESLVKNFLPVDITIFGHVIYKELNRNSTSWLHFNLASIYWRIKGDGNKAVDCIKLAIQHVTEKQYRDLPLFNLAGVLHQARHSKEAAEILHSAVEIAPNQPMHYLALGNIYASKGDFNKSILYYDEYLKFKPEREDIVANKQAILCYWKLEQSLMNFQGELQSILNDLHDYHSLQQQWLRLQQRLMWEHASFDYQYDGLHPEISNKGDTTKKVQRCIQKTTENSKKPVISCDFYDKGPDLVNLSLQNLFEFVENEKQKLSEQIGKAHFENAEYKHRMPPVLHPKFPLSMSTKENQYFDVTGWPSKDECIGWNLPVDEKDDLDLPVFLPPENKGFQVKSILSTYIGLSESSQHALPWYPPVCESPNVNGEKYIPTNDRSVIDGEIKSNSYLKKQLLKYANEGKIDETEIGQRIITAMEKKAAPRWVLATLASLYWRVRGNARKSLDCLDMAFPITPKDTTDMVLVSLGSVLYQMGFLEQAMKFASLAFKINYIEPSTNFLLALLHYSNNNPLLAMYYMKNVLRVESDFYEGKAEVLLKTWGCRIKMGSYSHFKKENVKNSQEVCAENEFEGDGVVCSKNGEHCKSATIQCFKKGKEERTTKSTLKSDICGSSMERVNLGQTIISSLLAAEGSGDVEPDQSRLVTLNENPKAHTGQHVHHHVHMRLSLGEDHPTLEHAGLGDFFVSVSLTDNPESENKLLVYDKYGTYTLSATECKNVKILHKFKYSTVWPSIVARSLDLSPFLKPIPSDQKSKDLKPFCIHVLNMPMPHNLDELTQMILSHRLPSSPEKDLVELLGLMASNQKLSVRELGARIALALKEDETSWILLTAAAIFWRIVGNSEQAVICLRAALTQVKPDMMDIPLLHLANLLNRVGYHGDALDVANLALKTNHYFILNHFTLANIHISTGEYEKAVAFFRACLSLDQNFEPARVRLKAVLCTLLFDENASSGANGARRVMEVLD